jgi:hypothetical protein
MVDVPTPFSISGTYEMVGQGGIRLDFWIRDMSTAQFVFRNLQISSDATNEIFTLGRTDGVDTNYLIGSLTGIFQPGRPYELDYYASIYNGPSESSASAEGYVSLAFVPEPTTLIIWSLLGTLAISVGCWRRYR